MFPEFDPWRDRYFWDDEIAKYCHFTIGTFALCLAPDNEVG
jgi:hypothetical protein